MADEIPPPPLLPPGAFPPPPPQGFPPPLYTPGISVSGDDRGPSDPNGPYAGFWRRFGGRMLDGLILSVIGLACLIPAFVVAATGPTELESCVVDESGDRIIEDYDLTPNATCEVPTTGTILAAVGVGVLGAVPLVLVSVWYYRREGRTGRTWGRSATGTRLVDAATGLPIGGGRAFGRSVLSSVFLYALGIGHLWVLWDKRKQTWHDKVMTTVVVRTR